MTEEEQQRSNEFVAQQFQQQWMLMMSQLRRCCTPEGADVKVPALVRAAMATSLVNVAHTLMQYGDKLGYTAPPEISVAIGAADAFIDSVVPRDSETKPTAH